MEYELESRRLEQQRQLKKASGGSAMTSVPAKGVATLAVQNLKRKGQSQMQNMALSSEILPYGVHHIDPAILSSKKTSADSSFIEFVINNTQILRKMKNKKNPTVQNRSSDPAMVLAFTAKLNDQTKEVIDRQVFVQQLYECRIASLERYVAFCVMFHAMADASCRPWFSVPWNISRSQSNLRVATTGSLVIILLFYPGASFLMFTYSCVLKYLQPRQSVPVDKRTTDLRYHDLSFVRVVKRSECLPERSRRTSSANRCTLYGI